MPTIKSIIINIKNEQSEKDEILKKALYFLAKIKTKQLAKKYGFDDD